MSCAGCEFLKKVDDQLPEALSLQELHCMMAHLLESYTESYADRKRLLNSLQIHTMQDEAVDMFMASLDPKN